MDKNSNICNSKIYDKYRMGNDEVFTNINYKIFYMENEIKRLETIISELIDKIGQIANHYYREKEEPYVCPKCNGEGKLWPAGKEHYNNCNPCEGRGILWK